MDMHNIDHICCLGASRSGVVTMLLLARRWPAKYFYIVDNREVNESFGFYYDGVGHRAPVYEPGLRNALLDRMDNNLFFTEDVNFAIQVSEIIFIGKNLELVQGFGREKGFLELGDFQNALRLVNRHAGNRKCVIELENIPTMHTSGNLEYLGAVPEHLLIGMPTIFSQGTAIVQLGNQRTFDFSLKRDAGIGAAHIADLLTALYSGVDGVNPPIVMRNVAPQVLEFGMLIVSTMLADRVCQANIISSLCGKHDVEYNAFLNVLLNDIRIGGNAHLIPGVGFSGTSMERDLLRLAQLASNDGLDRSARFMKEIISYNKQKENDIVSFIIGAMGSEAVRTVVILGVTIKPRTNDVTNARSLSICSKLLKKSRLLLRIYDPRVNIERVQESLRTYNGRFFATNHVGNIFNNADVVVVMIPGRRILELFTVNDQMQWVANHMRTPCTFLNLCPSTVFPYLQLQQVFNTVRVFDRP